MTIKKAYRLEHKTLKSDCKKVFAGPYSFSENLDIEVEDWADEETCNTYLSTYIKELCYNCPA